MRNFIIILVCILITACNSKQNADIKNYSNETISNKEKKTTISTDTELKKEENLNQFIPKGFHLIQSYSSDLNMDSLEDKLILCESDSIRSKKSNNSQNGIRPLILLLRQKDKTLKEVVRNDDVIYYEPSTLYGGDAFDKITFEKSNFTICYFYHLGDNLISKQYILKYSKTENNWFLNKISLRSNHHNPSDPDDITENYNITYNVKDFGKIKFCDINQKILEEFKK